MKKKNKHESNLIFCYCPYNHDNYYVISCFSCACGEIADRQKGGNIWLMV